MRRVLCLVGVVLVFALSAMAQDYPKAEVFGGYSYVRVNIEGDAHANLHGGSGSVAFNVNNWLGIVGDFGGYKLSEITVAGSSASVDGNVITYLFGPRISFRGHERVTPFAQALFGGARLSDITSGGTVISSSENAFAMALGGGLDVKASDRFAIRIVQAEYVLTRFTDPTSTTGAKGTQNNARISAGIVFRW